MKVRNRRLRFRVHRRRPRLRSLCAACASRSCVCRRACMAKAIISSCRRSFASREKSAPPPGSTTGATAGPRCIVSMRRARIVLRSSAARSTGRITRSRRRAFRSARSQARSVAGSVFPLSRRPATKRRTTSRGSRCSQPWTSQDRALARGRCSAGSRRGRDCCTTSRMRLRLNCDMKLYESVFGASLIRLRHLLPRSGRG
jgi:hypothetical protein